MWPFDTFTQIVFVLREKVTISIPDLRKRTAKSGGWFAISPNSWEAISSFSGAINMGIIECSREIWKSLTSEQDTLTHTPKACFSCSQRIKPIFVKNPQGSRTSELAQQLSRLDGTSASNRLMIEAKVLELLATTLDSSLLNNSPETEPCIRDVDQGALVAAAAYIQKNLAESHSLNAVNREARLNEFKLKKRISRTFSDNRIRLSETKAHGTREKARNHHDKEPR